MLAAIARLDHGSEPIAETHRRLGTVAAALGLVRPSYQQTRLYVHAHRSARLNPGAGEILLDINFRTRPPEAILEALDALSRRD